MPQKLQVRLDEVPHHVNKKLKDKTKDLTLEKIRLGRCIPEKKKKSLKHLMSQQFGKEWENDNDLQWYRDILCNEPEDDHQEDDDEECECLQDDIGVHI